MPRTLFCRECKWEIVDFQGRLGGTCPMCGGDQLTIRDKADKPAKQPARGSRTRSTRRR